MRLNGWKEIAQHVGKGVRTVQRWEERYGLPVHRIGEGEGKIVFADPDEIDTWLASEARRRAVSEVPPPNGPASSGVHTAEEGLGAQAREPGRLRSTRRRGALLAFAGLVLTLAIPMVLLLAGSRRAGVGPFRMSRPHPASWRLEGDRFVALDSTSRPLWSQQLDLGHGLLDPTLQAEPALRVLIDDIDDDGEREVVAAVMSPIVRENRRLLLFDSDGRLRWGYQPVARARFGSTDYAPPWPVLATFVTRGRDSKPSLWGVFTHGLWFPTIVDKLDVLAGVQGRYWSNGFVHVIREVVWQGREVILIGAANNEHHGGSLAILPREAFGGRSPAEAEAYRCDTCPGPEPLEFLVFPRMCTKRVQEGNSFVSEVLVEGSEQLIVFVDHSGPDGAPAGVYYTFDRRLTLIRVEVTAEYRQIHERMRREGRIDHAFSESELHEALPVRRWRGSQFEKLPGAPVSD